MTDYDLIEQFIADMAVNGCEPSKKSDIVADDKWHRYLVVGDKKPNGRYQLKIENGFGVGRYINFRDGESFTWHSKVDNNWTAEEKKAYKEKIAREKAQREEEQKIEFAEVAKKCTALWRQGKEANHPYLKKKKITSDGSRVVNYTDEDGKEHKNLLLIPIYKENKLSSLQRIWKNGFKAFFEGGDVNGGYTVLATKDDPKDNIIICEGWATGKSLRAAMVDWPVFVAFNAGNLKAVCEFVRKKYKDARIIIAADNDQWTFHSRKRIDGIKPHDIAGDHESWQQWRNEGRLVNVGLEKARGAAVKVGAHVIYPDIPSNDPDKNTDFNDLEVMRGLDAVRDRILVAAPARQPVDSAAGEDYPPLTGGMPLTAADAEAMFNEVPAYDEAEIARFADLYATHEPEPTYTVTDGQLIEIGVGNAPNMHETDENIGNEDWQTLVLYNDEGKPKANSLDNARLYIENDPHYKGLFVYDSFAHEKIVAFKPPWERTKVFEPRTLRDEDVTCLAMHLEKKGLMPGLNNLRKVLDSCVIANQKNPAQEYFKSIKWDGVPRLDTWLRTYCGATKDDPEYTAAIGRKWLTAAVSRVMRPGCKFENILIFEGEQGLGKSLMLRELATIHGRAYFDDSIKAKDLPNPSIVPKLQGVLIVELAEMSGFNKMGVDEAKQAISIQYDRIVKKYQNEPTIMPRQFVMAGTINPTDGYLEDVTGNRRYWPVECTKLDIDGIKRDREQLWAEAYALYKAGEKIWLDGELNLKAKFAQERRLNIHPWQFDIEKTVQHKNIVNPNDLWNALNITDRTRRTKQAQSDISNIMIGLGFTFKRTKNLNGKIEQLWKRNEEQQDFVEQHTSVQMKIDENEEDLQW